MPDCSATVALQGSIAVGLAALATASFLRASPGVGDFRDPLLLSFMGGTMGRRPLGVTILGVLILIAALILALIGIAGILVGLIPGSGINAEALLVGGLISLIIAIVLGIAGSGLLSLRPWAWWLATIVTLAALIYTGYGVWQAANRPGQGNTVDVTSLLSVAFLGVIFVYLLTVYRRFRLPMRTA